MSTCFQYKGSNIQYSNYGCSFFAIDNLFRLSNRHDHWNDLLKLKKTSKDKQIVYFSDNIKEFPKSLAFIFKNVQSLTAFASLGISKNDAINKKGDNLQQIVEKYSHDVEIYYGQSKPRNLAILHKREKYINHLENFSEIKEKNIDESRQGFEIIGGKEWIENNYELLTLYIKNLYLFNSFIPSIPNSQQIAIYEILKENLHKEVRDGSNFDNFIRNLTPMHCEIEYNLLKEKIRPSIRDSYDFSNYIRNLTLEQRTIEYEFLKEKIRSSIRNTLDLKCFFESLTPEQQKVELEIVKKTVRSYIHNGSTFNDYVKYLTPEQRIEEFHRLKQEVRPGILKSEGFGDFGRFLYYLEPAQCKIECEEFINFLMKNNPSSAYNRRYFSDAFGTLPHHEQRVIVMMAYNSPEFNKKTKVANSASNSFFSHKANQENNEGINDSLPSASFTR